MKKIQSLDVLRCLNLSGKIRLQEKVPNTCSGAIFSAELLRRV